MAWTNPKTWNVGEQVGASGLNTHLRDNLLWVYNNLPKRATLFFDEATVVSGTALTTTPTTSQMYSFYTGTATGAQNDEYSLSCVLAAGTYTLTALGLHTNASGIIDWYIDGALVGSNDWYAASTAFNVTKTLSGIVVPTGGVHTIRMKMASKNALSANYRIYLTKLWLKQATD